MKRSFFLTALAFLLILLLTGPVWSQGGTGIGTNYTTYKQLPAAPSTPGSTYDRLYFYTGDLLKYITSAGTSKTVLTDGNYATNAETVTGTATDKVVTPAGLTARFAAPGTIGGTTPGLAYYLIPEVDGHTDATVLSALQASGTVINSYGRTGAATLTLPAAARGLNFIAIVGTQHNSAWKIQRAGTDTIIVDGTASKTYIQETNQAVGSSIACHTFQTGAAAWTWKCSTISGTWATD